MDAVDGVAGAPVGGRRIAGDVHQVPLIARAVLGSGGVASNQPAQGRSVAGREAKELVNLGAVLDE